MKGLWIFLLCVGVLWGATLPLKMILRKEDFPEQKKLKEEENHPKEETESTTVDDKKIQKK